MIGDRSPRIHRLVSHLYANLPEVEAARAVIVTESFMETESLPIIKRKAHAFAALMDKLPIVIREGELIVGSPTRTPRGCQTFPEFSWEWLAAEFDTLATRSADPFFISEETKQTLHKIHPYWKGKTTSDLALSLLSDEAAQAIAANVFTVGNYLYNGIGHLCVRYDKVIAIGYEGISAEARALREKCHPGDADYATRTAFLDAVILSCEAAVRYAARYAITLISSKSQKMGGR